MTQGSEFDGDAGRGGDGEHVVLVRNREARPVRPARPARGTTRNLPAAERRPARRVVVVAPDTAPDLAPDVTPDPAVTPDPDVSDLDVPGPEVAVAREVAAGISGPTELPVPELSLTTEIPAIEAESGDAAWSRGAHQPQVARSARPFPATSLGSDDLVIEAALLEPKKPLLVRLLRLQHVRPTGWQRAAVGDLPILLAVLLVLSDLATAWTLLVLPVVVLALVKFHDVIESRLAPVPEAPAAQRPYGE